MTWKEILGDAIPPDLGREIDAFETEIHLRKQGKIDEKVFAETRLRRGVYGQRYDNGQRNDGLRTQSLNYPSGDLTKGPSTLWDAPGMQRIKIPYGGLNPRQLEVLADLAEEYSDGILHVTTRQDIQLHYVHIDETPDLFRRLAAVGITTREACGNAIRNVTGCPLAGVCRGEAFDITPNAKACARFLLGHKDTQSFGRKFKIAFSGCEGEACGLARMHDIGAIGKVMDGKRGFAVYVGGGLGAVPSIAKLFSQFVPQEEILPLAQAISRVYARLGEKKNRNTARLKFLVNKIGIEEFRRVVLEERQTLPSDPAWTSWIGSVDTTVENPVTLVEGSNGSTKSDGFEAWLSTNVYAQRQHGYRVIYITLPLGDFTPHQARAIADLSRRYASDTIRLTVDQNMILRWIREGDLPELYGALREIGLGEPGANSIVDVTACPGTDTCKLGISSSRGLAGKLRETLGARFASMDEAVRSLKIKISGCFNSCGQHHIADLGFYGVSRKKGNFTVPHFQVMVGGEMVDNAGSYGLPLVAIPSKRIPEVVDRLTERYLANREKGERFNVWVNRIGKAQVRKIIDDLTEIPTRDEDRSYYSDWRDPREYSVGDMGVGECAGEVVSSLAFALTAAERQCFEAQLLFEAGDLNLAAEKALGAMLKAAHGFVAVKNIDISEDREDILREFRVHFYDTKLFWDPFAGGRFGAFLFSGVEMSLVNVSKDAAHRLIEEAQLFIEASHTCRIEMAKKGWNV